MQAPYASFVFIERGRGVNCFKKNSRPENGPQTDNYKKEDLSFISAVSILTVYDTTKRTIIKV